MKKIILYTSSECPYCTLAEERLREAIEQYKGLFTYTSIHIDKKKQKHNTRVKSIKSLPTIIVGDVMLEGIPELDQIHTALFS